MHQSHQVAQTAAAAVGVLEVCPLRAFKDSNWKPRQAVCTFKTHGLWLGSSKQTATNQTKPPLCHSLCSLWKIRGPNIKKAQSNRVNMELKSVLVSGAWTAAHRPLGPKTRKHINTHKCTWCLFHRRINVHTRIRKHTFSAWSKCVGPYGAKQACLPVARTCGLRPRL